ncbi:MAG: hypothetical protein GEU78_07050 [Actinobacteria bacterium]|nr:hypothetical protein [Actinomycetota bacterium]
MNFLFDPSHGPHLTADALATRIGVAKSTMANKARVILQALDVSEFDLEFSRREILMSSPVPWLVEVDGIIMDARDLPDSLYDEARRRGLIPDLPRGEAYNGTTPH